MIFLWLLSGVAGFIFWYTKDTDFKTTHILPALLVGIIGPISWVVGYMIYGKGKTLIKKRDGNYD